MEQISYAANNSDIMRKAMQFSLEHLTLEQVLVVVMYGLVVLVSLLGNLLVCKVILFKRAMRRRTTNIFIANLTIADLLMTVFTIPMFIVRNLTDNWPLGSALCKLVPLVQALSVYVSVLAMTLTAIDRYQALVKPLEPRLSHRLPKGVLIGLMWAAALLLAAPNAVFNIVVEIKMFNRLQMQMVAGGKEGEHGGDGGDGGDNEEGGPKLAVQVLHRCKTVYPEHSERLYQRALTGFAFATQFLLPLLVVAFCYLLIGVTITRRKFLGECITTQQAASAVSSKRKTIKMLMLVVAVFALSWLPYNLLYILKDFREVEFSLTEHYIAHWVAMSSLCYNPFIYFGLNKEYRQGILAVFSCCCCFSREAAAAAATRAARAAADVAAVSAASTTERNQSNTEIVSIRGSGSLTRKCSPKNIQAQNYAQNGNSRSRSSSSSSSNAIANNTNNNGSSNSCSKHNQHQQQHDNDGNSFPLMHFSRSASNNSSSNSSSHCFNTPTTSANKQQQQQQSSPHQLYSDNCKLKATRQNGNAIYSDAAAAAAAATAGDAFSLVPMKPSNTGQKMLLKTAPAAADVGAPVGMTTIGVAI